MLKPIAQDRRDFLQTGLFGLAGASLLAGTAQTSLAAATDGTSDPWMDDPEQRFLNYLRITTDISGRVSLNYWRGGYLAVLPDRPSQRLFRLEGCEMRRCIPLGGNRFRSEYRLMTSITDPITEAVLNGQEWQNPFTGETNTIQPNTSSVDTEVYLEDGRIMEKSPSYDSAQEVFTIMSAVSDKVFVSGYKSRPGNTVFPLIDYATILTERSAAMDWEGSTLPATFNSTFVAPFQRFMNMPQGQGHAAWHVMGFKLQDWSEIPAHHVAQIEQWLPEAIDWAKD